MSAPRRAVVLMSGGLVSGVTLAIAHREPGVEVKVALHYAGSRRAGEDFRCANRLAKSFGITLEVASIPGVIAGDLADQGPGLYAVMLSLASFYADRVGAGEVWSGINPVLAAGPNLATRRRDQAPATLEVVATLTEIALGRRVVHRSAFLDRVQAFRAAHKAGVLDRILEDTHDCHVGMRGRLHDWGYGCGACDGCVARGEAWSVFEKGVV